MAKRRTTHPKEQKPTPEQEDHATSHLADVESNPTLAAPGDLTAKPWPKPRPKPAKQAIAPSASDAMDEIPHQHPKRSRS